MNIKAQVEGVRKASKQAAWGVPGAQLKADRANADITRKLTQYARQAQAFGVQLNYSDITE